jgi:tetratricopeptide (TPR) repeat protein
MTKLALLCCTSLAVLGLGQPVLRAATPEPGNERLRKLLKLPTVSLEAAFSLNSEEGFAILEGKADAPREIVELRKQLKSDSSDAERYSRLGELYTKLNDAKKAAEVFDKSASLFRQRVAMRPDDAELLASFGRALWAANQSEEAESVLRRAVQLDAQRAASWQTLGHFLESEAKRALVPGQSSNRSRLQPETLLAEIARNRPPGEQLVRARKLADEASACFDKAVLVSTNSSEAYLQRALHKSFDGFLQNVFAFLQGEKTELRDVMQGMFSKDCVPDFKKAAELSTSDYRPVVMAAFFESFASTPAKGHARMSWPIWEQLPDATQKSIRAAITRLENLGQEPEAKEAAGALQSLAVLQGYVVGDRTGAERSARRAVLLDPRREQAWDLLTGFLLQPEKYDELRNICEERVRQKESARNRILLAKAYERLNQLTRAEQNVQLALKLDGNDFTANLCQAALVMKRNSDSSLGAAYRYLSKAEQVLKKENRDMEQRYLQLALISSIYYALGGETEKARQLLRGVLESDKNNQDAREIMSALAFIY